MRELSVSINVWIKQQTKWFTSWQLNEAVGITSKQDKTLRRVLTKRLCDKGILVRHPTMDGVFRYIKPKEKMDW